VATQIITRAGARAQGLIRYFTGKRCKRGHLDERHTASGTCIACGLLAVRAHYKKHPEAHRARAQRWRCENPDRAKESSRRYNAANPEKRKAATDRWRAANPDALKATAKKANAKRRLLRPPGIDASRRKWLEKPENKAKARAAIAAWQAANPDAIRTATRNRRARLTNAQGEHTAADLAEILTAQGNRCAYCRADLRRRKKHVDHIKPLARGGSNGRSNLQYLCAPCNQAKSARDPIDYAQSVGFLL
jgi:hypothetical protein